MALELSLGLGADLSRAVRTVATGFGAIHTSVEVHSPRDALLQGFADVARRSVGVGWCVTEDGCGRNMRNGRLDTRGCLLNAPVVATYISST